VITWGAIVLAVIGLIVSVLDDRRATRPQRTREKQDEDYDRDIRRQAQAAATGDAATLAQSFEAERQAAIRRGDIEPAPIDDRRDRRVTADPPAGERMQRP
jgi:hypothetical protein